LKATIVPTSVQNNRRGHDFRRMRIAVLKTSLHYFFGNSSIIRAWQDETRGNGMDGTGHKNLPLARFIATITAESTNRIRG
jgi:hypothetical protein